MVQSVGTQGANPASRMTLKALQILDTCTKRVLSHREPLWSVKRRYAVVKGEKVELRSSRLKPSRHPAGPTAGRHRHPAQRARKRIRADRGQEQIRRDSQKHKVSLKTKKLTHNSDDPGRFVSTCMCLK